MKAITQKSAGDWMMRWRIFMLSGLVLSVLVGWGIIEIGKKRHGETFPDAAWAITLTKIGMGKFTIKSLNHMPAEKLVDFLERKLPKEEISKIYGTTKLTWYSPVFGFCTSLVVLLFLGNIFQRGKRDDQHIRGATLADAKTLKKLLKDKPANFELAGVPIPEETETTHFAFCGGTKSGKSEAIKLVFDAVQSRKQRAFVADPGGGFLEKFYREGDHILNPFDTRSAHWSPFAEMRGEWDADLLAKSIIPDGRGTDSVWDGYAQEILSAVLLRLWQGGKGTNREMVRLLTSAPTAELKELVSGLPAQRMFDDGNEKFRASVLAIISANIKPFSRLNPDAGADGFSIKKWVEDESGSWIFLTFRGDLLASLRPLIAAQIDLVASSVLSLPENHERRVWLILDEFPALGRIQSIEPFLSMARKSGGCALLGVQAFSQLRDTYGKDKSQTLLSNCCTCLVFRQSDNASARDMSFYLGEREVLRQTQSGSMGGDGAGNWSERIDKTHLVLDSDLQRLNPGEGFLSLLGNYPIAKVKFPEPVERRKIVEPFMLVESKSLELVKPASDLDFKDW